MRRKEPEGHDNPFIFKSSGRKSQVTLCRNSSELHSGVRLQLSAGTAQERSPGQSARQQGGPLGPGRPWSPGLSSEVRATGRSGGPRNSLWEERRLRAQLCAQGLALVTAWGPASHFTPPPPLPPCPPQEHWGDGASPTESLSAPCSPRRPRYHGRSAGHRPQGGGGHRVSVFLCCRPRPVWGPSPAPVCPMGPCMDKLPGATPTPPSPPLRVGERKSGTLGPWGRQSRDSQGHGRGALKRGPEWCRSLLTPCLGLSPSPPLSHRRERLAPLGEARPGRPWDGRSPCHLHSCSVPPQRPH